ncbi:MAG TPA: SCE4755 family polysaccharide monooxygenase-like protein, partial [Polyangiaceae bacterium]
MSRRFGTASLACVSTLVVATSASAHVRLDYPTPRYPEVQGQADADIKQAPCGNTGDSRTTDESRITTLEAGSTITVEFREAIPHPGWFRIAFDDDGQDDFPTPPTSGSAPTSATYPILVDGIPGGGTRNMAYTAEITLPDTPCDNCTLQLIQVMTDRPNNPSYYTCADIVLTAPSGAGGAGGSGGAGGGGT